MSDETQTPDTDETVSNEQVESPDTAPVQENEPDARIAELEAENAAMKDQLVRTLADMDNLRKRTKKEVTESRVYAIEKFAGDLLSVSDNMTRALEALNDEARAGLSDPGKQLLAGVEMTQKDLHAALARHGVSAVDAAPGAAFDPNLHQAVTQLPSEHPQGTVAETYQTGWKIGDRTLRAAMVAVSAGGGAPAAPAAETTENSEPSES